MKSIVSISLAFLVLALSFNVKLAYHYCDGKLAQVKMVVGHGEATCGMEEAAQECYKHRNYKISLNPCCQDRLDEIKTDNFNYQKQIESFSAIVAACFIQTFFSLINLSELVSFSEYRSPPLITTVSLSEIQVFLI